MKCEKIKDLLMTDYIDAEASLETFNMIEAHLKDCAGCRAVKAGLRGISLAQFEKGYRPVAPSSVWLSIEDKINKKAPIPAGLRPALAMAALLVMAFTGVFTAHRISETRYDNAAAYIYNEIDYLASLSAGSNGLSDDIGIPMEDYSV